LQHAPKETQDYVAKIMANANMPKVNAEVQAVPEMGAIVPENEPNILETLAIKTGATLEDYAYDEVFNSGDTGILKFDDASVQIAIKNEGNEIKINNIQTKSPIDLSEQISGTGRGSAIVNALKDLSDETGASIKVMGVTKSGEGFWQKNEWLKKVENKIDGGADFEYTPALSSKDMAQTTVNVDLPQTGGEQLAQNPYGIKSTLPEMMQMQQAVERMPNLTVMLDDGAEVSALDAVRMMDDELMQIENDAKGFEAAVTCFLRTE
jgi:hypothetical protein